jgi:hydroxyethylthiazole kinase-like uncharacterized protein yjeF
MQKVFKNCYGMDKRCYDEYGLSEDILMEHAAGGMESYIRHKFLDANSILIVAGPGNNGADGIAMARLMTFRFVSVRLYLPFGVKSEMAKVQIERVQKLEYVQIVDGLSEADIVVDALFGAGLSGSLDEKTQDLIDNMNDLGGYKVACDIPSGLDEHGFIESVAFAADLTLTMGARKEALYSDVAKDVVGDIWRIDLGVRYNYYTKDMPVSAYLLKRSDLMLPTRELSKVTHKGNFGHVAVLCGEKEGAGIIAGMSAGRFGAGLTTLVSDRHITPPSYLMHSTEVPTTTTALAVGMGMGSYFEDDFLLRSVVQSHLPIVLDADGLNSPMLLEVLNQKERSVVLTPHPKEFARLWEKLKGEKLSVEQIQNDRFGIVRTFMQAYPGVVLLLKGANMLIANEEKIYINPFGSSKLSKGGSGDVLSGLIAALLAQGYSAIDAAIQGSLALTEAADKYDGADYAMLPTDLIEQIGTLDKRKSV